MEGIAEEVQDDVDRRLMVPMRQREAVALMGESGEGERESGEREGRRPASPPQQDRTAENIFFFHQQNFGF